MSPWIHASHQDERKMINGRMKTEALYYNKVVSLGTPVEENRIAQPIPTLPKMKLELPHWVRADEVIDQVLAHVQSRQDNPCTAPLKYIHYIFCANCVNLSFMLQRIGQYIVSPVEIGHYASQTLP